VNDKISSADHNRLGYDRWSSIYDSYINSTVAVDDASFPKLWAHVQGVRVLEIGCGTGRHTRRLAMAGNEVTAIDMSSGMIRLAQEKLASFTNIIWIEADFLQSDLYRDPYDVVLTALVLEHISDLLPFFQRVAKALKRGGAFYMSEIHPERIKSGTQANFQDPDSGEIVFLSSFAHSGDDIEHAAASAGLELRSVEDLIGDEALARQHEPWSKHLGKPMIRMWIFAKTS